MAFYNNRSTASPIASVEFSPVPEGNVSFITLKEGADAQGVKQLLTRDLGQAIEAETTMGKRTVLVTRGDKTQEQILSSLKARGESLTVPEIKEKPNLWKLRGWASIIGQPLQLLSGLLQKGTIDSATIGFAATNMAANVTNIVFGAQKDSDTHHLRHLKTEINQKLASYLPEGITLPDVDDKRIELHKKPEDKSIAQKVYNTAQKYSVTGGEIGLRYIGAISLAFPITKELKGKQSSQHWKTGLGQVAKGELGPAFKTLRNSDRATLYAGLAYIGGKAIALTSKVEDPYNETKKHSWVDTLREKVVFRLSSSIEAVAAAIIALDRFNIVNFKDEKGLVKKRSLSADGLIKYMEGKGKNVPGWLKGLEGKKTSRDWLGGIGGALFTTGLLIRIFAPFGVREVDKDELNAHIADSLALVPPEKLPQATAQTAAFLTDHFKDQKLEFGKVYTQLANDLYRYHNIALPGADGGAGVAAPEAGAPERTKIFAKPGLKKSGLASLIPPASYQDRVTPQSPADSIAMGM